MANACWVITSLTRQLAAQMHLQLERFVDGAAAGQDLATAQQGQRWFGVLDAAGLERNAAGAAVAAAALIFDMVAGAFQRIEQGFITLQLEHHVFGHDLHAGGHSSNSPRSSTDTDESIWPTR